jgi:hypothetical protein
MPPKVVMGMQVKEVKKITRDRAKQLIDALQSSPAGCMSNKATLVRNRQDALLRIGFMLVPPSELARDSAADIIWDALRRPEVKLYRLPLAATTTPKKKKKRRSQANISPVQVSPLAPPPSGNQNYIAPAPNSNQNYIAPAPLPPVAQNSMNWAPNAQPRPVGG